MRRDPRLIEQAFKGGRCRLACSPFNATGSAARQARSRPEENLAALAALTENFLSEAEGRSPQLRRSKQADPNWADPECRRLLR
jgi:hypothetical protein